MLAALVLLWPAAGGHRVQALGAVRARATPNRPGASSSSFVPPAHEADFLALVARETWRTVAIATAGITLALVLAVPMTLLGTRVLSISALSGRMARAPFLLRQAVRWLLIVLRSDPGAGVGAGLRACRRPRPDLGRAGHRADLRRHAGQGLRRDPGIQRRPRFGDPAAQRRGPAAGLLLRRAAEQRRRADQLHRLPLGMCDPHLRWCWASSVPAAWASSWTPR